MGFNLKNITLRGSIIYLIVLFTVLSCSEDTLSIDDNNSKLTIRLEDNVVNTAANSSGAAPMYSSSSDYTNGTSFKKYNLIPNNIAFENWYSLPMKPIQTVILSEEDIANNTANISLERGSYKVFASSNQDLSYNYGTGASTTVERKINIKHYGRLKLDDRDNTDGIFIIGIDDKEISGSMHMQIVNEPMVFRFEQLCNHPSVGEGNENWQETRNKLIEYVVKVRRWNRKKGDDFVEELTNEQSINDAYESLDDLTYYIYVFYHDIYVFNSDGALEKHSKVTNFNNDAVYDLQLDDVDKSEVSIKFRRRYLTTSTVHAACGDEGRRVDARDFEYYTDHWLTRIIENAEYNSSVQGNYFDMYADHNFYGDGYCKDTRWFKYNSDFYTLVYRWFEGGQYCYYYYKATSLYIIGNNAGSADVADFYSRSKFDLKSTYKAYVDELINDVYQKKDSEYQQVQVNNNSWIKSNHGELKKYRIIVDAWDGRTDSSQQASSKSASKDLKVQCIQEQIINLNN